MDDVRIDLHTHSTASDGTDTPAELVRNAVATGLHVVAITDHDTAAGWREAVEALPPGLSLVRGAELSCSSPDGRGGHCTVHLLGYLYDPASHAVAAEQARLREERKGRFLRMATMMAEDGFPVDPEALLADVPPGGSAGRPHLARALVSAGVVGSVREAFDSYLAAGGKYHLHKQDTSVYRAISMVRDAGGVTVLAHAFASSRGPTVTAEVIADLAAHGLVGLEVDHPDHDEPTRERLRGIAADLGLVVTGSSDYHGDNKTIKLGQETTAPEELEALLDRATGVPVVRT